ncbi:MAG TPA: universal stress protein, partial [Mucilaginibacter sp.]|nr:universal stress protein [Mucilaginibacter sp.]
MMIKKILIGIDDSKQAEHAAEFGFDIARKFNAEVGLVNIVSPAMTAQITGADPLIGMTSAGVGIDELELLELQKNQSENIVEQTIKKFAGDLAVTHFTEYGSTADGIISCSKEFKADLIVIGTHSRSGLDRLLMGSTAEHVVRHSPVPVLVVPLKS